MGVLAELARGEYEQLVRRCFKSRLTAEQLRRAVRAYGRKIIPPPQSGYPQLDAVAVTNAAVPTWSVWAPLWTLEEGRSDLQLELTISLFAGEPRIELDDLRVP